MTDSTRINHSIIQKINFSLRKSVPQIIQNESSECGLACLAMICGYYNYDVDLLTLRQSYAISAQGATLSDLCAIAKHMKFDNRALALDLNHLKKLKLPCILHWDLNHFVVLVAVRRKSIVIHDPAVGQKILSYAEFSKHFTGVAMEMWPTSDFVPKVEKKQIKLLTLLKNVDGLYSFLLKVFALTVIIEIITVLTPIGTQLVLDHVILSEDTSLLTVICLGLLTTLLFRTFIGALRNITTIVTDALINAQWSIGLFSHLFSLPLDYFEKRRLGDIQSRFLSLDQVRKTFTSGIIKLIVDGMMSIILIIMMYVYGGWLLWVVLFFNLIYWLMRAFTYRYFRDIFEQKVVKEAKENSFFMESLYGINTIKALNLSNQRIQHWSNLRADHINAEIKITRFNVIFNGTSDFVGALDEIIVLWIGALMVIGNEISLGMFIAFTAYRGQFSSRSSSLIGAFLDLRILSLHSERIADIVLSKKEHFEATRDVFHEDKAIELEVNNLVYRYDAISKAVINNLTFTIKAGEHVAITGPSGVGKTTLIKILAGLMVPTSGSVLANKLDITKMGVNNYRDAIACVLQDDKLLAGSILDNISSFNAPTDVEWAMECAKMVNMHEEVMQMAMGYETIISELGGSLSGGQKQRLLLARALYRKPKIMFLDEATSHLDTDNESIINASISKLNITRVVVAHRPSTIEAADRIITLSKEGILSY